MTMIALYPACRPVSRRHYTAYASPRPDAYPGRPVAPAGFEKPGYATSGLKPDAKPLARPVASVFRSVRRLFRAARPFIGKQNVLLFGRSLVHYLMGVCLLALAAANRRRTRDGE